MRVMQGTSPAQHGVMDAESWLGGLLPSGSVYAFLAEHRRQLFPDAMFADLFPSPLGRPSVPADVVAAVLVLQALEGRSDREAAEALTFDLRWKAACGLPVAATAFHPTVLTYWRRRLRSEEHTSELQSLAYLVCRLLLEKKKPKVKLSGLRGIARRTVKRAARRAGRRSDDPSQHRAVGVGARRAPRGRWQRGPVPAPGLW